MVVVDNGSGGGAGGAGTVCHDCLQGLSAGTVRPDCPPRLFAGIVWPSPIQSNLMVLKKFQMVVALV